MAKKKSTKKKTTKKKSGGEDEGNRINYSELSNSEKKKMIDDLLGDLEGATPEEGKAIRVKLRKLGHEGGLGKRSGGGTDKPAKKKPAKKKKRTRKKSKSSDD